MARPPTRRKNGRNLPAIATAKGMGPIGGRWGPIMDSIVVHGHPFDPAANPLGRDIPVMVGCTADEQTLYNVGFDWWGKQTEPQMVDRLKAQYGPLADRLVAAAKTRYPKDDPSYLFTDITSKAAFVSSAALAERKSAQPAAVYMYVWEGRTAVDGGMMRAPHTTEIPFAFDNVALGPMLLGTAPATLALGRQASAAWTAFARRGDPNDPKSGPPHWPRYDTATRATMIFNLKSRIDNAPFEEFRKIMPAQRPV
jgi:para-nitrobenzyl esterase